MNTQRKYIEQMLTNGPDYTPAIHDQSNNLAGIAMRAINENKELHTKIQNIYQVLNESLLEISHWREFRKFQDEEFGVPVGEQTKYFDTEEWNLVEDRAREMYIQLTSELKIYLPNNVQFIRKQDA